MLSLRNRLGIEDSKLLLVVDPTEQASWSACRLCAVVIFYSFSCVFGYVYDSSVSDTVSCLCNNIGRAVDQVSGWEAFHDCRRSGVTCYPQNCQINKLKCSRALTGVILNPLL